MTENTENPEESTTLSKLGEGDEGEMESSALGSTSARAPGRSGSAGTGGGAGSAGTGGSAGSAGTGGG
jgi:hypothetical protein